MDRQALRVDDVQTFSIQDATDWMHWSGTDLADVVNGDETPGVRLGAVGFARAPRGSRSRFEFPYDEVLVVTKGSCTVQGRGGARTARAAEVLYLRAGTAGSFVADEAVELVYVASSPYGEVNREAKAALLGATPR